MADHQISEYERFINQVAADTEVTKLVLTTLIAKLVPPGNTALVDELEAVVTLSLERAVSTTPETHLTNRLNQLKLSRTEDYFRALRTVLGVVAAHSPSPRN